MPTEILDSTRERMSKTISVLEQELNGLRAGRANPQLLDRLMVADAESADRKYQHTGAQNADHLRLGPEGDPGC